MTQDTTPRVYTEISENMRVALGGLRVAADDEPLGLRGALVGSGGAPPTAAVAASPSAGRRRRHAGPGPAPAPAGRPRHHPAGPDRTVAAALRRNLLTAPPAPGR